MGFRGPQKLLGLMGLRSLLISKLLPVAALILGLLIEIEAFIGIIIVMMMRFPFVSSVLVAVLFGQNGCGYGVWVVGQKQAPLPALRHSSSQVRAQAVSFV